MSPRTGRPTENPKSDRIGVRVTDEEKKFLQQYSSEKGIRITDAIREGINKLREEKN